MTSPSSHAAPPIPRTGVVTVSYASDDVIQTFLASIPAASAHAVEVVVADNKNDSSLRTTVEAAGARYIGSSVNGGYGAGINRAVDALHPDVEWVLVSNPDIVLSAGSLDVLVARGESDSRIAAIGPRIVTDGGIYPSARAIPSLRAGTGHALFATIWPENPWSRAYRRDDAPVVSRDAGWLSGACLLVRRRVFDELGGFDPAYFMYFEDVDLGYRIGRLGYRNVYEPAASVRHLGGHSTDGGAAPEMIRAHHRSARRFIDRKYRGPLLGPVRVALRLGLAAREWWVLRRTSGD
jgi:N-acetylglucosaminyl-diphospho-decaprenol L-rhamnosyltransferase